MTTRRSMPHWIVHLRISCANNTLKLLKLVRLAQRVTIASSMFFAEFIALLTRITMFSREFAVCMTNRWFTHWDILVLFFRRWYLLCLSIQLLEGGHQAPGWNRKSWWRRKRQDWAAQWSTGQSRTKVKFRGPLAKISGVKKIIPSQMEV